VIGLGADDALLPERGEALVQVPSRTPRLVVSTVGAGDTLLAAFVAGWAEGLNPHAALERAVWFAGWKVGEGGEIVVSSTARS
jgi:ribokinase